MSFEPIYVDRRGNSDAHVGGLIVYLLESDSDVSSLPQGLPGETGSALPLVGSLAIVPNPKKVYVLGVDHNWVAVE